MVVTSYCFGWLYGHQHCIRQRSASVGGGRTFRQTAHSVSYPQAWLG